MSRKIFVEGKLKDLCLTKKSIAYYIMQTENKLNSWIAGNHVFPYSIVWKIADLLNIDPDDLRL